MDFFLYRGGSCYQFLELWWMFLIVIASGQPWQANGTRIMLWIALEVSLQFWVFREKFQFVNGVFWAAACVGWLGLCSWLMYESIRLRKTNQIPCNDGFEDLIFKLCFFNLFHAFLYQLWSNQSKSFLIWLGTNYWV